MDSAVGPRQLPRREPFAESLGELGDRLDREAQCTIKASLAVKGGLVYSPQAILWEQDAVRPFAKFSTQVTD